MPIAAETVLYPNIASQVQALHQRENMVHDPIEGDSIPLESSNGRRFKMFSERVEASRENSYTAYMQIYESDKDGRAMWNRPLIGINARLNDQGDLIGLVDNEFRTYHYHDGKKYQLTYQADTDESTLAYLSHVKEFDTETSPETLLQPEQVQQLHLNEKGYANRTNWVSLLSRLIEGEDITGDTIEKHLIPSLSYTREDLIQFSHEKRLLPDEITIQQLIEKTKTHTPLTRAEIFGLVNSYVAGAINDENDQMAGWITAVYDHGLSLEETIDLTMAMAASGEVLDMAQHSPDGIVADKHSSGGVGDKTSLVVAPLVAACDVTVGKMSGRGLGHTGGTLDKMEAIPSPDGEHTLNVKLSQEQFIQQVKDIRIVISGQSDDLAPADGKIYALRNKIGKIASIPLIASSIMSKKIASGCNVLVLDVTVGDGAFMKTVDGAHQLARIMVDIGKALGMKVKAELSNMDMPRGYTVGNALEVREAVEILSGDIISQEFYDHCVSTAAEIVQMAYEMKGMVLTDAQARNMVEDKIKDGSALKKFKQMVEAQGGDVSVIDDTGKLPQASLQEFVYLPVPASGYIQSIHALQVGEVSMELGGGRLDYKDKIDPAVGIEVGINVGQWVDEKTPLFRISANDPQKLEAAIIRLQKSIEIGEDIPDKPQLIYEIVD